MPDKGKGRTADLGAGEESARPPEAEAVCELPEGQVLSRHGDGPMNGTGIPVYPYTVCMLCILFIYWFGWILTPH